MMEPRVIGNWKREKELGSGGFGVVSLWRNAKTKESLAIKKCKRFCSSDISTKDGERWELEVEQMKEFNHENIVQYIELPDVLKKELHKYNPSGLSILSMEYCKLGNLRSALKDPLNCCGFSESTVLDILSDTSSALQYLHEKQVTHRDFKPENIVIQHSELRKSKQIYKIIDLGYAKQLDSGTVSFVGTMQYLAPEIFSCRRYSKNVDYWSFGITAFEIICGVRPFLPTLPPLSSFAAIQQKNCDVICIQLAHTDDIKVHSNTLLQENWLTECMRLKLTNWLKQVLQFDPQKRGTLAPLSEILSTKVITIFCVITYKFYSYEITETTRFNTWCQWIADDVKSDLEEDELNFRDLVVVPTKKVVDQTLAMSFYDENNREAMAFVLKKNFFVLNALDHSIPSLMVVLLNNKSTTLNVSTLRRVFAQTIFFVRKQENYLKMLKNCACFIFDNIKQNFERIKDLFDEVQSTLPNYQSQISLINEMENSALKDLNETNLDPSLNRLARSFQLQMVEFERAVKTVEALKVQDADIIRKYDLFHRFFDEVIEKLTKDHFHEQKEESTRLLTEFYENEHAVQTDISLAVTKIIAKTMKINKTLTHDVADFFIYSVNYSEELKEFILNLKEAKRQLENIAEKSKSVLIQKLKILIDSVGNIQLQNEILQNQMQLTVSTFSRTKNLVCEINDDMDTIIQEIQQRKVDILQSIHTMED